MKRKVILKITFLLSLFIFLLLPPMGEAQKKITLIGRETPFFTLPSTFDRVISYGEEYYGKYHLIITFFPAAFTPI